MNWFKKTFNSFKESFGFTQKEEQPSQVIKPKEKLSQREQNILGNYSAMMRNRIANRRMRNKMRRATQQSQRG